MSSTPISEKGNPFFYVNHPNSFLNSKILIQVGESYNSIPINDIIHAKAEAHYTTFILANGSSFLATKGLKFYEESLANRGFFKANRSELINIQHIDSIFRKETITLSNRQNVNVSTRNRVKLGQLLEVLT